ncbi:MAG TPA: hypothetical protein VGA70_14065 [Longimicrobiales bacterium]|jgi:hypothetical protein
MQSLRDHRGPGSAFRVVATLTLAAASLLACGSDESPDAEPAEFRAPATVPEPVVETAPRGPLLQGRPVAVAVLPPSGRFPHDEHRGVRCSTCHESVAGHGTHSGIDCGQCHELPEAWSAAPTRPLEQCMACHHEAATTLGCAACHEGGPAEPIPVMEPFVVAAAPPEDRTLAFSHAVHARQDCTSCHRQGVALEADRECASCHIIHHSQRASCLECHQDARASHQVDAHLGCGGAGCHTDRRILSLPEVRTMCVACHSDMVDHNPDSECVVCHVTGREPAVSTSSQPEEYDR